MSCLLGSQLPEPAAGSLAWPDPVSPAVSRLPVSGKSPPYSACRSVAWPAPPHHRRAPQASPPQCASRNTKKLLPTGPLHSSRDLPSTRSPLRVALTCPASSSLRPKRSSDRRHREAFYLLATFIGW